MEQTAMSHSFDTHKYIKALVAQGMKEPQAELVVSTIVESRNTDLSKLVTREEFSDFKSYTKDQFGNIKNEIDLIKRDIDYIKKTMATKEDLASMRAEFSSMKYDILKWTLPFVLGNTIAILGIIVALFFR